MLHIFKKCSMSDSIEKTTCRHCQSRVSVIVDCPQMDLFHNLKNIIITPRIAISELVDNNTDNE